MEGNIRDKLSLVDKTPLLPNDKTEEELVLGAIYTDFSNYDQITDLITSDDYFYHIQHRQLWKQLKKDIEDGRSKPDPVTYIGTLTAIATHQERSNFLNELETLGSGVGDVRRHAEILKEFWTKRKGILFSHKLRKELSTAQGSVKATDILSQSSSDMIDLILDSNSDSTAVCPEHFLDRRIACMKDRVERGNILTNMPFVDKTLTGGGFLPGKITILVGRPSGGKTIVRKNWEKYWCESGVGVFSLPFEPGIDDDMDRMDSLVTGIPIEELKRVKDWDYDDSRKSVVVEAQERITSKWYLTYNDSNRINIDTLPMYIRQTRKVHRVDIVTIDVLAAMSGVTVRTGLTDSINYHLKMLRRIAKDLFVHILVVTHLSRDFEKNKSKIKKPTMAEIKQSGGYEEDADQIFAVWRPRTYNQELPNDFQEIIVLKQKDGPAGPDYASWNRIFKATLRLENFTDLDPYSV